MRKLILPLLLLPLFVLGVMAQGRQTPAQKAGVAQGFSPVLDLARLALIDDVVQNAIKEKQLPGAVVLVGRGDTVVYRKAFGNRAVEPAVEPMTVDTIFDLASLTKVVATTTSAMLLVQDGRVRL